MLHVRERFGHAGAVHVIIRRQDIHERVSHSHATVEGARHVLARVEVAAGRAELSHRRSLIVVTIVHKVLLPILRSRLAEVSGYRVVCARGHLRAALSASIVLSVGGIRRSV